MLIMTSIAAFALNQTEIDQIRQIIRDEVESEHNATRIEIEQFREEFKEANFTNGNLTFNQSELDEELSELLINQGVLLDQIRSINLSADQQKQVEAAISNEMDRGFLDVQQWIRETLLPSQQEKDQLQSDKLNTQRELDLSEAAYKELQGDMEQLRNQTQIEINSHKKDKRTWQWLGIAMGILLLATVAVPWLQERKGD